MDEGIPEGDPLEPKPFSVLVPVSYGDRNAGHTCCIRTAWPFVNSNMQLSCV